MDDREERIRHRAYALWQAAGEPEGRDAEFWTKAEFEIVDEEAAPSGELPPDIEVRRKASEREAATKREEAYAGDKPGVEAAGDDLPMPD
jgi:hypothetical protein